MSEQNAQKTMDPTQLHKMTEVLGADLRNIKEELEKERADKQRMVAEQQSREAEYAQMSAHMNLVKEEKKQYYSGLIDDKVKPYFEDLRKQSENDSRMTDSLNRFETQLNVGLDNAFMDPDQLATLQVAVAASANNQVTSSKLEELFQSQKQWEDKFGALQKEKEELEAAQTDAKKGLEDSNTLSEKMVEDLKKELADLKAKHEKSINNAEGHFEEGTDAKMEDLTAEATATLAAAVAPAPVIPAMESQQATVAATASDANFYGGFNTLFDFAPRDSWRSNGKK